MKTCPVCNSPMLDSAQSCSSCGYHLQGSTQKFEAVSLETSEPETIQVTSTIATLTVLQGKQKGIVYSLDGDKAVIGRSPKCEIFLNDMTVSRKHAVLERVADGWSIQDTDSFNGVWVNNTNIDHVMLSDRDIVQIGCFVLRYAE